MSNMSRVPYRPEEAANRRQQDVERKLKEQAAARTLDRSQIGNGGVMQVLGSLEVLPGGDITLDEGDFVANNVTAHSALAGATVTASSSVTAASAHVTGVVTADGGVTSAGVQANDLSSAGGGSKVVYINNTSKQMGFLTSSRRFKQDIQRATGDLEKLRAIHVYFFRYKEAVALHPDDAYLWMGAMAEDLHDAGFTQLVDYGDDGKPFGLQMQLMWVIPHLYAEQLDQLVGDLASRVAALEAR